jgi:hypothetical protein
MDRQAKPVGSVENDPQPTSRLLVPLDLPFVQQAQPRHAGGLGAPA